MKVLTLILTFAIVAFSHAISTLVTRPQPQMNLSSMLNHTQQHVNKLYILHFYF
jgi:capsular polysaccharide biosynthesis protein